MLNTQEIRQLQMKDLQEELAKSMRDLMRVKMELINGHSKESHQVKSFKKYIARLQTIKKENSNTTSKNNNTTKQ